MGGVVDDASKVDEGASWTFGTAVTGTSGAGGAKSGLCKDA